MLLHALHAKTRRYYFAFPMVDGQDYAGLADEAPPLQGGGVKVWLRHEGQLTFVALAHPLFLRRTKETIYPDARRRHEFLAFFGLWNRCVAELLLRYRAADEVGLYHCMDYHTALAPWYLLEWGGEPIPMSVTLHNALYQGSMLAVCKRAPGCAPQ